MGNYTYAMHPAERHSDKELTQLALDLRWSWNHAADQIWKRIQPELWELTRNPWLILQTVSQRKLDELSADPSFQAAVSDLLQAGRDKEAAPTWFQKAHANSPLHAVAYFSMEYMLCEALPIYSGGLGNVAGDQLKAASDLGVPVIGIGLLYQQGYFRQEIDRRGAQLALYPFNDPGQLPIKPLRDENGDWVRLAIVYPGFRAWVRAWEVQLGRVKLYLLDSNDPANLPQYRGITAELYGGGPEVRLKQELILGIGGWRLLRTLGIEAEVCHLNEGHAAFAVVERALGYMQDTGRTFEEALLATRAGNLFTTHTPVEAGFDRFEPDLICQYLSSYAEEKLQLSMHDFLALGRRDPDDTAEPFNMAYLAIRGSGAVNGVSRLHGKVSRRLFLPLFPQWPEAEVPVTHVTNGVHVPTWDSAEADDLWHEAVGQGLWRGELEDVGDCVRAMNDARLWRMRSGARMALVKYIRQQYARQVACHDAPPQDIAAAHQVFDANTLTLGFARRFATYKRPNLLLHDPDRLVRLLTNSERPVQLVLAGKAHPQDFAGQDLIRQWSEFIRRPEVKSRVVFLSDYDMMMTERLVEGVDVWINTPLRPWEASGTSGMKVLVNGGLNLSELDGWWAEAYAPEVGWAIGDGAEHDHDPAWDAAEAEELYRRLEDEVIPEFYRRSADGIPVGWIKRMRESMARLTPAFSANRTVREYTESHYLPAAAAYAARAAKGGKLASELLRWQNDLAQHWKNARFGAFRVSTEAGQLVFEVELDLGGLDASAVRVELFADGLSGGEPIRLPMEPARPGVYAVRTPATRPATDFTPRLLPYHAGAALPLEARQILWQR